ncbi:VanZ family protein [Pseudonocardia sp. TRM90224]|uniref:VanZ family protein n=1 Tax=Pseudonocardia sp. TRM90224 TaxID=2812678 RepID=UPI001E339968|nr:VanZ family protein [Pseudonocardia sp. TRM90224]
MTDIVARWGGVILTALAAVPIAGLVAWALMRWRGAWREPLLEVAMVLGTLPWLWMILRPNGTGRSLTLLPLTDLADLGSAPAATVVEQLGGNLLVFAALGCCLPMRWAAFAGLWRVALVAAGASVGVEVLQYALAIGRHSSVDDVLLNTAGAVLAAACSRRWWTRRSVPGRGGQESHFHAL